MTGDDRLRAELRSLEEAAPADLPLMPTAAQSPRWRRLALPAAVMVIAGTLIGLSVPTWLPGALPFGLRVGELVPVPTGAAPAPSGQPVLCHQALMAGTLVRDPVHGFVVANGDHRTPVRWPNGYVGREGSEGLELLNEAGQVVAREGDYVELGGGQGGEMWLACPGPRVIPTELPGRLAGDPRVEDGCIWLETDVGKRHIVWPAGYDEAFRDGQPVLLRDGEVVARAGDQVTVRGAPGDMGYACIGFSSYVVTQVVTINPAVSDGPSAEPSAGLTHVAAKSMSLVLPDGWSYRLPDRTLQWGMGPKFMYFSNQPMQDECERIEDEDGITTRCGLPVDELVSDGIFVEWWNMSWYWLESPPPLPEGTPYALGGREGVRAPEDIGECGQLGATYAELITLPGTSHLRICARDPRDETLAVLEALLQSIAFDPVPDPTPSPTFDDDPAEFTGVLRGDPNLAALCTWLTDGNGDRWEIIWPDGYEDTFDGEVPVLLRDGEVVARGGDVITVTGATSTRYGTFCMVGIPYGATQVQVGP